MEQAVLRALGVVVVEVDDMHDGVCWVASQRVALVRSGLSDSARDAALDWITQMACQEVPHPRRPPL